MWFYKVGFYADSIVKSRFGKVFKSFIFLSSYFKIFTSRIDKY